MSYTILKVCVSVHAFPWESNPCCKSLSVCLLIHKDPLNSQCWVCCSKWGSVSQTACWRRAAAGFPHPPPPPAPSGSSDTHTHTHTHTPVRRLETSDERRLFCSQWLHLFDSKYSKNVIMRNMIVFEILFIISVIKSVFPASLLQSSV